MAKKRLFLLKGGCSMRPRTIHWVLRAEQFMIVGGRVVDQMV